MGNNIFKEMIYDKDLRIGNFILIDGSTIGTIREIRENHSKVLYKGEVNGSIGKRFSLVDYERIKSIQITEEWLLKFGFTLSNIVDYESNCGLLDLKSTDDGYLFDSRIIVKSVHQLQNLYFAITQTELELK